MQIKAKSIAESQAHQRNHILLNLFISLLLVLILSLLLSYQQTQAKESEAKNYKSAEVFLAEVFSKQAPKASIVWITGDKKEQVKQILGHKFDKLRVKYWIKDSRSAWILDEIGKEKPITTGIVVNRGRIERVEVLTFRESRGWEVKHPFFTNQFKGISVKDVKENQLDKNIDGITGATLSVNALSVKARMALYLHRVVTTKK